MKFFASNIVKWAAVLAGFTKLILDAVICLLNLVLSPSKIYLIALLEMHRDVEWFS